MLNPERRTVDELVTLYRLEPQIRDLYVEGVTDRGFYRRFLADKGCLEMAVLEIDSLHGPEALCEKYDLSPGNRSEIIALARELTLRVAPDPAQATCVIDSDLEVAGGPWDDCPCLFGTDFPALESYGFDPGVLRRVLASYLPGVDVLMDDFMAGLASILRTSFAVRTVNADPRWRFRWLRLSRCCELVDGVVALDVEEFSTRLLNTSGRRGELDAFLEEVRTAEELLDTEDQMYAYGHDLTDLLSWYIRSVDGATRCDDLQAKRAILIALDSTYLGSFALFQTLVNRATH